jgi:predicted transcriptional regulator YheO
MKCVSIVLRDGAGAPLGLLCLNTDVSGLDAVRRALDAFLAPAAPQGEVASLFVADWHESVNRLVAAWTAERGLVLDSLDRAQRRALIAELQRRGAFEARRAPAYVARLLGVSRATLYGELAALRAEAGEA